MKKIAIIPARSGSKGLKDKNIIDVCGKPLLAYSIEAAILSECFDRVIVSTDSKEYGHISEQYGAEVMYRSEELSNDQASTYSVLEDIIHRIDRNYDYFVLLQPTSPMRNAHHIVEAIEQFETNYDIYDFLVSVKEAEHASILVNPIEEDLSMKYFDVDYSNYRRQNYKEYSPNGAIYMAKPDAYLKQKHFYGANSMAYVMSDVDSMDIDSKLDYDIACFFMSKRLNHEI